MRNQIAVGFLTAFCLEGTQYIENKNLYTTLELFQAQVNECEELEEL